MGSARLPLISGRVANHQGWFLCGRYLRICYLTLSLLKLALGPLTGKKAQLTLAGRHRDAPDASGLSINLKNNVVADRLWNRHSNCRSRVWIEVGDPRRRNNSASTHQKQDQSEAKRACHGFYRWGMAICEIRAAARVKPCLSGPSSRPAERPGIRGALQSSTGQHLRPRSGSVWPPGACLGS